MKIGVCIRAKDEIIINDWINYYIQLGFDRIIIYDNMSKHPIQNNNNKVIIITDTFEGSNQPVVYQECINNNKDLDWLLLCDADEFIYIKNGTIKDFLSTFSHDTCTILINWLVFGTNGKKTYDTSKTVFEQFTKREDYNHFWNQFVKSFIRPKLIDTIGNVHITYNSNYKIKNVYNQTIVLHLNNKTCDVLDINLSDKTPVVIIHYMLLDFENMLQKNIKNRNGQLLLQNDNKYSLEWYNSDVLGFKENNYDTRMNI